MTKRVLDELRQKLLYKEVDFVDTKSGELVLKDGTRVKFDMTAWDCCATAGGQWNPETFEGVITDVQIQYQHNVCLADECWGLDETSYSAVLSLFHNQNPVAQANLSASNGNGDYYFSVLSVFVNDEELGTILSSLDSDDDVWREQND